MKLFGFDISRERRSIENPNVPLSAANARELLGWDWGTSAAGIPVTIDNALGVPAVWSAVNFLSGTMAGLPVHHYKKTDKGRERVSGPVQAVFHDAINDEMSSFEWRKHVFDQVFTGGRSCTYIEWNAARRLANLWPLDPTKTVVKRDKKGRKTYEYSGNSKPIVYEAAEIIDLAFMFTADMLGHRSPLMANKDIIGMALAVTEYGSKFFWNGGVPPFAVTGPFTTPAGVQRASDDLAAAVRAGAKDKRQALVLPMGHEIKPLGADPEKSQLVELQRFIVEQVARIYGLPPVFLQDLTHGTFSNTEQQDLMLTKHTIKRWTEQFEQEVNLKLFGRGSNQYIEMNMDGLLRGDFKTRMDGNAQAINTGQLAPNEARERENLPALEGGDKLFVQGAMVPIEDAGKKPEPAAKPDAPPTNDPAPERSIHLHIPEIKMPEIRIPDVIARVEMPMQPAPVVNVEAPIVHVAAPEIKTPEPRKRKTRTKVLTHDAKGRVKEFEQEEID